MLLDKRTGALILTINKECTEGSFKVLEISELIAAMPEKYKTDIDNIKQMMELLKEHDLIQVKYSDDNVFCLAPTPKGRLYHEQAAEETHQQKSQKKIIIYMIAGAFIAAFLGAFLAILFIGLIYLK